MKKLALDLEQITVESFDTTRPQAAGQGTVHGNMYCCCCCCNPCCCGGQQTAAASCNGTCDASCNGTCAASCNGSCAVSCDVSCGGTCDYSCYDCYATYGNGPLQRQDCYIYPVAY